MDVPPFVPHPLVRGGHVQTLFGHFVPGRQFPYTATPHELAVDDGDRVVVHDDRPPQWEPGQVVTVLVHGLAGCHQSPYLNRVAGKLNERGCRTFRMDLRGCGAGLGLARKPYHAGRSEDLAAVVRFVERICPGSPINVVGFSLGGNIVLKYLGEHPAAVAPAVRRAVTLSPCVDLPASQVELRKWLPAFYDRYFTRLLIEQYRQFTSHVPAASRIGPRPPRRLAEFDGHVTAPLGGFEDADHYYASVSARQWLHRIDVPTLIVTAADDPLIPAHSYDDADTSPAVHLIVTRSGGHLGFFGCGGRDPDRRWMDWRIVDWCRDASGVGGTGRVVRTRRVRTERAERPHEV